MVGRGGQDVAPRAARGVLGAERVPPLPLCPALQRAQQRPQPLCILEEIIPGWQEREVGVLGWGHGGGGEDPSPSWGCGWGSGPSAWSPNSEPWLLPQEGLC